LTGKRSFGSVKRETIVVGEKWQLRESVDVMETGGNKDRKAAFQHVGG